jgi:hypothetical protein
LIILRAFGLIFLGTEIKLEGALGVPSETWVLEIPEIILQNGRVRLQFFSSPSVFFVV